MVPSLAEITSTFQPAAPQSAHTSGTGRRQTAMPRRRRCRTNFQHDVAIVHRILRQQRDADLLRELEAARLKRFAFGFGHAAHFGLGCGIGDQRIDARRSPHWRRGRL